MRSCLASPGLRCLAPLGPQTQSIRVGYLSEKFQISLADHDDDYDHDVAGRES